MKLFGSVSFYRGVQIREGGTNQIAKVDPWGSIFATRFGPGGPILRGFKSTRTPGLEWRIFHILTSEDIDDVISRSYTVVCAKILVYIIKRKLHGGKKKIYEQTQRVSKILVSPLENKIYIFAPLCNFKF